MPRCQVAEALEAAVGHGRQQPDLIEPERLGINLAEDVPQDGLKGRDRLAFDRHHPNLHQPLARGLPIPEGLEQPAVEPGQEEPEQHAQSEPHSPHPGGTEGEERREHSYSGNPNADRQVDQEGRQAAKRSGHAVVEGNVLWGDDFNVRIKLPRRVGHRAHYSSPRGGPQAALASGPGDKLFLRLPFLFVSSLRVPSPLWCYTDMQNRGFI